MQGRHGESCQDQSGVDCLAHGPADDFAAVEVQNAGEIEPTLIGENVGDIGDPGLVECTGFLGFCQGIGSNWVIVVAIGGLDPVAALLASTKRWSKTVSRIVSIRHLTEGSEMFQKVVDRPVKIGYFEGVLWMSLADSDPRLQCVFPKKLAVSVG